MGAILLAGLPLALLAGLVSSSAGYYGEAAETVSDVHEVRRRVLRTYAAVALGLGPLYTGFFVLFDAPYSAIAPGLFTLSAAASNLLVRSGRYRAGAVLLSWSIWIGPEWAVICTDQLYSPLLIWMAPSAFMAGPLLGRLAASQAGLASVVFVLLMGVVPAEIFGIDEMSGGFGRPLLFVLCGSSAIGLVAFYGWSATGSFDDAREALEQSNRDMAKVLDNVQQGLAMVDARGRITGRCSATVVRLLGEPAEGDTIWQRIGRVDAHAADCLELGWEALDSDWMPHALALDQLPKRFAAGDRRFSIGVEPLDQDGYLIVLTDITDELARARAESLQKQTMALFRHFRRDRCGVLAFLRDTDETLRALRDENQDLSTLKRRVHTVKGNSGLFGLTDIAERCHALEDRIAETGQLDGAAAGRLVAGWEAVRAETSDLMGEEASQFVEVGMDEVHRVAAAIASGLPPERAAELVRGIVRQPIEVPFRRFAEQARALARRLEKPEVTISIVSNGVRTDRRAMGPLFNVLVHVIRNAVDHGIESPAEREAAGKPPAGHLRFEARREDGSLVLEIADDGRGIPWEELREAAAARGLAAETHEQLVAAIFANGVTTRATITTVSGRGVGTAAVAREVLHMCGRIEVHSEPGLGATFRFVLPDEVATSLAA